MANGLWSLPLISTPFWANRYVPLSVASEHFALLEASSFLAYPAPTVVRAAAPTTSRISATPPAHSPFRFIVVLLLVCRRPERKGRILWDSLPEGILTGPPTCRGLGPPPSRSRCGGALSSIRPLHDGSCSSHASRCLPSRLLFSPGDVRCPKCRRHPRLWEALPSHRGPLLPLRKLGRPAPRKP